MERTQAAKIGRSKRARQRYSRSVAATGLLLVSAGLPPCCIPASDAAVRLATAPIAELRPPAEQSPPAPCPAAPPPGSAQPTVAVPVAAQPAAGALSLEDALTRAMENQPAVAAARQRVAGANFHLAGARALPNTLIDLGHGQEITKGEMGATGSDQDIMLTQHLDLFGQRGLRGGEARRELTAARAQLAAAQADVTFRVRSSYAAAVAAAGEVAIARQSLAVAETFQRVAQLQFEAGDVPLSNVFRSEIEVENASQSVLAAETALRTQQAALNAAIVQPVDTTLNLPPVGAVTLRTWDLAALQELALQGPALQAAEATLAARRSAVAVANAARRPDVVLQLAHDQLQLWPGGNVFRAGLVFPIFDRGQVRAAVGEARAAADEQQATLEGLRQQVSLDVATAYLNLEQARQLVERTSGAQLQRAQRLYEMAQIGYREGASSHLDLIDAQQVLRTALTNYLHALSAYQAAEAALEHALGQPLPEPRTSTRTPYSPPTIPLPTLSAPTIPPAGGGGAPRP